MSKRDVVDRLRIETLPPFIGKREIRYGEKFTKDVRDKAISDVRDWLGDKGFDNLVMVIKSGSYGPRWIRNAMAFLQGIEGFPVRVMIQRYHPVSIRLFGVDGNGRNVVPFERKKT